MKTTKSFAHQYGISQRSNPSLGLNPNLNIQDEYIQNLLKQTHFLNMQIKLIKQKQKQNKGMGIMGLLNKDQNPVVTHAITSNTKYAEMKQQLSGLVNTAEADYLRLDDENYAVKAQRDCTEKLSLKQEQKNIEHKIYVEKLLTQYKEKLNQQERKLKELREEQRKIGDNHQRVVVEWEQLTNKTATKELMKKIVANIDKENQQLRQKHFVENKSVFQQYKHKIQNADKQFRQDPAYRELVNQNTELKEKLNKTNKDLFDMSYKAKEMQQLKKLSLRNKDIQSQLKKQAHQQMQKLRKKLSDKKQEQLQKIKDSRSALQSNDEIRLLKGKLARKDKQTSDTRKKTDLAEANYKRLRDEVEKLTKGLKTKQEENKARQERRDRIKIICNEESVKLRTAELDFEKSQADLINFETSLKDAKKRLEELQEKATYMAAKEEYLHKEINIDEGIKEVKIQQLSSLMHSNTGLNDTISDLMKRWDQIVKFSREPPI